MAEQGSLDVGVTLSTPDGTQLLAIDTLTVAATSWPPEEIHWVAPAAGQIRLAVNLNAGLAGPCPLRIAAQRPATGADRARARAETALARAHALRRQGAEKTCREAVAPYREAERAFAGLGLARRRAEALFGLGVLHEDCLDEPKAAIQALARAAPLFADRGDAEPEATVRERLGKLYLDLLELDDSIREFRRAADLHRRSANRVGGAVCADNLGLALQWAGRYDQAAISFDRALELWDETDPPGPRANTLLNRGQLHLELGELARARERFQEALGLFRQARDPTHEGAAWNALGLVSLGKGEPKAALEQLNEALPLREAGSRGRAVTLTSIGVAHRQLGHPAEARQAYLGALPIFHQIGDVREEARCRADLGHLETEVGRVDAALAALDQAQTLFARLGDAPSLAWTLESKAGALRRRGDLAAAAGALEEALTLIERHRIRQQTDATRSGFFATQQGAYDALIDLLIERHRREPAAGHAAAALQVSERALARSLLDALAASGTHPRQSGAAGLVARERELTEEIDGLQASLDRREAALAPGPARTAEEELAEIARRFVELDQVREALAAGDPHYAALTQPQPWSAADVQRRLLDPDTLLLEYRLGEERSFLWAVTTDSLASFELPSRAAIGPLVLRACGLLAGSFRRKAENSAHQRLDKLGQLLLGPVSHLLPGKRLVVVADGVLQYLPFAALPDPQGGEPLIARHEVVSLPSASMLGVLRREVASRKRAPQTLWVLADPTFLPGGPPRLPDTRQEAERILAFAPAGSRFAALGKDASREAVLASPLGDYRYLHFATHGFFDARDPAGSHLVLADGLLRLPEVYRLDLRADLVTLSACRSALGKEVRGEGLVGLTRGFFYAGAERVLVSLWNVNDRSAVELMERFYRAVLLEGASPAAALRSAQDAIRRQRRWRAPYHWAGFVLQGEWRGGTGGAAKPFHEARDLESHTATATHRRMR